MRTRYIVLSLLIAVALLGASWPYLLAHGPLPDTTVAWVISFVLGFACAVYALYVFLEIQALLLLEDQSRSGGEDDA